jgi:hypothetical protein
MRITVDVAEEELFFLLRLADERGRNTHDPAALGGLVGDVLRELAELEGMANVVRQGLN